MRVRKKNYTETIIQEYQNKILDKTRSKEFSNIVLEIGSGKAGFITQLAFANKEKIFIALEKERSIVSSALKNKPINQLDNLYFLITDVDFLPDYLNDAVADKIYINFPDPWPKKKHHKRRLLTRERLKLYSQFLKSDGMIEFKSDNYDLYLFALENFGDYQIITHGICPPGDYQTEYEIKFRNNGQKIYHILAKKH